MQVQEVEIPGLLEADIDPVVDLERVDGTSSVMLGECNQLRLGVGVGVISTVPEEVQCSGCKGKERQCAGTQRCIAALFGAPISLGPPMTVCT